MSREDKSLERNWLEDIWEFLYGENVNSIKVPSQVDLKILKGS